MEWNWQQPEWPNFKFNRDQLVEIEAQFLLQGGTLAGAFKHLNQPDENELMVEVLASETVLTSAIEGEILDRDSVRASIRKQLGLSFDVRKISPKEIGASELNALLLNSYNEELSHKNLFHWHKLLMNGSQKTLTGKYRTHQEPMQIVSRIIGRERVHFEAPPSKKVKPEMDRFVHWFNDSKNKLPSVTRSGIAHIYFESIHPFEDGNGRIGRAISEMALAQGLNRPSLTMLSTEIESNRSQYYAALEFGSKELEITDWLIWFGKVIIAGQIRTQNWIDFLISKARLLNFLNGKINTRQEQALLRMFSEGPSGFTGGMSSGKYQKISNASPATANRDLNELEKLGALRKTGSGKGTRFWLNLD